MAELRLLPLEDMLGPAEIDKLLTLLVDLGIHELPDGDDVIDLDDSMSDEQLTDFLDRLEAHDVACDIYLPVEFEGNVDVGDQNIGSAFTLAEALEELREELDIDAEELEDDVDPDEDESNLELMDRQLSAAWHAFARAANACVSRQVPLHVIT